MVQMRSVNFAAIAGDCRLQRCWPICTGKARVSTERVKAHDPIRVRARRVQGGELLGVRQCFAYQAPIHLPRGEVRPFNRGGMTAEARQHLARFTIDDLDVHTRDPVALSFFDNLDILPIGVWLFTTRRSPAALIGWNLPPGVDERRAIVAFAIGRHSGRRLGMPPVFELGHRVVCKVLFRLANRTSDTQPRIHIQRYATPEGVLFPVFGTAQGSDIIACLLRQV
jgi:hypothetical protein